MSYAISGGPFQLEGLINELLYTSTSWFIKYTFGVLEMQSTFQVNYSGDYYYLSTKRILSLKDIFSILVLHKKVYLT